MASFRWLSASQVSSPVLEVVNLLRSLESRVKADGILEQRIYDKAACWCEDATAKKANEISEEQKRIEELQAAILQLEGDIGSHGADIKQLKKDVALSIAAQKEASEVRKKAHEEYMAEKLESEQSIGALREAVAVLKDTGTGKKAGLLGIYTHDANLLGITAGLRRLLVHLPSGVAQKASLSEADMVAFRAFIDRPSKMNRNLGALQMEQNPFGDYAPQSTQIQGILKGMLDAFIESLAQADAEEKEAHTAFTELMQTKRAELKTLQQDLMTTEANEATKAVENTQSKIERGDVKKQLAADRELFEEMKASCKHIALQWGKQVRLRTEELAGVKKAIEILSSTEAQKTFENATTTLLQVRRISDHRRSAAIDRLHQVAVRRGKASRAALLAAQAATAQSRGHFDKVMSAIDEMIAVLRREEQDDIEHRDRCQKTVNKNKNDKEDLQHSMDKDASAIDRMSNKADELRGDISDLEKAIDDTEQEMKDALEMRNSAVREFRQAMLDDTKAVELLSKAIVALTDFYRRNQISLELAQIKHLHAEPSNPIDGPGMNSGYEGRKEDSQPIIAMIATIKEDLQKEMKTTREENAAAQAMYEKERSAMVESVDAATKTKIATEKQLADLEAEIADTEASKKQSGQSLGAQQELGVTLGQDCAWVATHFDTRRKARKAEIEGLMDAKDFLAGAEK
eukprot:TRINITY_DN97_c1_g1_i1.p1 TRINITY_DN97_c1_g1~~TRINITY_DN97_c1_g1_i1.p1  ORF type:complete len:713 (+),score=165.86 TRINITY_DN97_c1_g1_i1:78-2141(+)